MDPLIYDMQVERRLSRPEVAMHTLQRAASVVKPLMRAHNFKVKLLAEFYPSNRGLLGLNTGQGMSIHLRLRYPVDANQFFPFQMVIDSLLHELSHNRFGPHDKNFHALWDQLRDEYFALTQVGFTGEALLGRGYIFGDTRIPQDEARRLVRHAAEDGGKNQSLAMNQNLGGASPRLSVDIRRTIVGGSFGRMQIAQGCAGDLSKTVQKALVDEAGIDALMLKAEEDDMNEVAAQQALWDLAQKGQQKPKKMAAPQGSAKGSLSTKSSPTNQPSPSHSYGASYRPSNPDDSDPDPDPDPSLTKPPPQYIQLVEEDLWQCTICTLINKEDDINCDACGVAQPVTEPRKQAARKAPTKVVVKKAVTKLSYEKGTADPWTCGECNNMMESEWWVCSACGTMKSTS